MSIHVMSWVLRNSEAKLGARLVLLVLADHAKEDGSCAWPAVETIAREARLSRKGAQDALKRLKDDGAIREAGKSARGTSIYNVVMGGADSAPREVDGGAGAKLTASGGEVASPEPSKEPSREPSTPSSKDLPREHPEFGEWIGHHSITTSSHVPKAGTKGRAHIATMFAARRSEGHELEELKLATVGAYADTNRRENGWFDPESVLRPTKVGKLIEAGRRVERARGEQRTDWSKFDE